MRSWPVWRRLAAEFIVIVAGVLIALGVDAARDAHVDQVRADAYLRQLRTDLSVTAAGLAEAISVDQRARDGADRAIEAFNSPRLPPSDSLAAWIAAATNSSADFYPTMGTVTALIESGEIRLIRDDSLRQKLLQYHGGVESALRIVDAVDPHTWRTIERLGEMLSWPALIEPGETHRFDNDWASLASNRAFHGALYDLRLAAHNRLFAMNSLGEDLESLIVELDRSLP
jgi:hypothetical protein